MEASSGPGCIHIFLKSWLYETESTKAVTLTHCPIKSIENIKQSSFWIKPQMQGIVILTLTL